MTPRQSVAVAPAPSLDTNRAATAEILHELSLPLHPLALEQRSTRAVIKDIAIALAVALVLRLPYFRGRLFPLNDGGMFAQIIDNIRAAHFVFPTHTTYNFLDIPLSYPPLGFYLGALCTVVTGQSAVSVLTWLPLALNLLAVVVIYFIAKEVYPAGFYACLAACCYASIGRSAEWLIMGGGLTRGLGMLFASVAILLFVRSHKCDSMMLAAWSGVCVGLAVLSHLEGGIFAALSVIVLSVLLPKRFQNLQFSLLAGIVSIAVVLPWVIWLYRHLGFGPLMNAAITGGAYYAPLRWIPLSFLAASIIFAVIARFPYVCWLTVIPWFLRRSGATYSAAVAGLCMVWFVNAIMVLLVRRAAFFRRWRDALLVALALTFSLQFSGLPQVRSDRLADLRLNTRAQVSPAELQGMQAAVQLAPANTKFFVFDQRTSEWYEDMIAEWFPYFTQRQCVNTAQGREWLPNHAFFTAVDLSAALEFSLSSGVVKILDKLQPDFIFVAGPFDEDHETIANTLRAYAKTAPIYKNSEVLIYKVERQTLATSGAEGVSTQATAIRATKPGASSAHP
ncbi:MAG: hypothetical protein DMG62_16595 [Acidobacteria bacterium]|nr:MAG: hypothetical protein DMG62_16595 [Acidobacteriota bacterium]